jgi:predicted DNA-binding protein
MPRTPLLANERLQLIAGRVTPEIKQMVEDWAWRDRTTEAAIVREAVEAYVRERLKRESRVAAA